MGMFDGKEEKLSKDDIFKLRTAAQELESFKRELSSFKEWVGNIDRRTSSVSSVDPERARTEVVNTIVGMLISDKDKLIQEIKEKAIERISDVDADDIDTERIEELLSESDKLINDVIAKLDIDNVKESVVDAVAEKIIEDHIDTDDISEKVSEVISERLDVTLKPNNE